MLIAYTVIAAISVIYLVTLIILGIIDFRYAKCRAAVVIFILFAVLALYGVCYYYSVFVSRYN